MLFESEYDSKDILMEFYVANPSTTLNEFIQCREKKFDAMCEDQYNRLRARVDLRTNAGLVTTELMKVKFLFFDWFIFTEDNCIVMNSQPQKEIPDSWADNLTTEYHIRYLDLVFWLSFIVANNRFGIVIQHPTNVKSSVLCMLPQPPLCEAQNDEELRIDRKLCAEIISRFTTVIGPYLQEAALGKKRKALRAVIQVIAPFPNTLTFKTCAVGVRSSVKNLNLRVKNVF